MNINVFAIGENRSLPYGFSLSSNRGLTKLNRLANDSESVGVSTKLIAGISILLVFALGLVMVMGGATVVQQSPEPTQLNNPKNMLVIPGVNQYIPLSATAYVLGGMLLAVFLHELTHAIFGLKHGVTIDEYGLVFLTLLPLGAYVRLNEEDESTLSPLASIEMIAAAPLINLYFAYIFLQAAYALPYTVSSTTLKAGLDAWASKSPNTVNALVPTYGEPVTDFMIWAFILSLNLALLNMLPIRPLDGGLVIEAAVEGISTHFDIAQSTQEKLTKGIGYSVAGAILIIFIGPFIL